MDLVVLGGAERLLHCRDTGHEAAFGGPSQAVLRTGFAPVGIRRPRPRDEDEAETMEEFSIFQ